jgi:methyltransferase (TIGR00027 family)
MVALLRALGTDGATGVRDFSDPMAERLLPPGWSGAQRLFARAARGRPWVGRALWRASLGMIDILPLRTRAIDDALRDGMHSDQLVILGAGLDGRAWRLPELSSVTVFEVDHPATQRYKRAQVEGMSPTAKEVKFVAVDFERDSLKEALARAGHRADRPTFWIWEGVIMYLHPDAMRATLDEMAELSAPGSQVAATYVVGGPGRRVLGWVTGSFREPLLGLTNAETIDGDFTHAGFRVLSDTSAREWSARYSDRRPVLLTGARILVAERLFVGERA